MVDPMWKVIHGGGDDGVGDVQERYADVELRAYLSMKDKIGMDDIIQAHKYEHYNSYGPEYIVIKKKRPLKEDGEDGEEDDDVEDIEEEEREEELIPVVESEPSTILLFDGTKNALHEPRSAENVRDGVIFDLTARGSSADSASDVCTGADEETGQCSAIPSAENMFSASRSDDSSLLDGSILIAAFQYVKDLLISNDETKAEPVARHVVMDEDGALWQALTRNGTAVHVHFLLSRKNEAIPSSTGPIHDRKSAMRALQRDLSQLAQAHSILMGDVNMIKQTPILKQKPTRILYNDLVYLYEKYVLDTETGPAPWLYSDVVIDENVGESVLTPHWKPEVAVKIVPDQERYPLGLAQHLAMPLVAGPGSRRGNPNYFYLPSLYVDEIGLTSDMYIPLNDTVKSLPLKLSFGELSTQRWRLISHLGSILDQSRTNPEEAGLLGQVEDSDIDDIRHLIADTNLTLLLVTMLASTLHLLFEFLTFKSDVEFWKDQTSADGTKKKKRIAGLSVRALFIDLFCQIIILAYLIDKESTLLITVPAVAGIGVAAWKCTKAVGRIRANASHSEGDEGKKDEVDARLDELDKLTMEIDRNATWKLGLLSLPLIVSFAVRSLIIDEYHSWYAWFISAASGSVYTFGFVAMTPQLFLNYKLKSVAHLPWRVLGYRFINTFIDDLFAFIIRMPTMTRISCFRDDIVFFIYLGQRWTYPVDKDRPAEGVGDNE